MNEKEYLEEYNVENYKRPSVTSDILIFTTDDKPQENQRKVPKKGLQVLLINRDTYPDINQWSIPGGFVNLDESIEDGAKRKLKEKTGIDNVYIEQLYTFGDVNRDIRTRVISVAYMALIEKDSIKYSSSEDKKESKWFWIDKKLVNSKKTETTIINDYILELTSEDETVNISYKIKEEISKDLLKKKSEIYTLDEDSSNKLAFDHYKIIDYALHRMRNKVEYTPIAFNLLPRLFTVKELQNVYEAVMGREILNFRRKMGTMIIETDEKIEGKPFRPAKVFKFNEDWEHNF